MRQVCNVRAWFGALLAVGVALFWHPPAKAASEQSDKVLLLTTSTDVLTGRFSSFARFQDNLRSALEKCGDPASLLKQAVPATAGTFGEPTRDAIRRAVACGAIKNVPSNSPAQDGVLTASVWMALMGGEPIPNVADRAHALVLSFEATDFGDVPEWNLCADSNKLDTAPARRRDLVCRNSSDPCSFITWGPRGATAGAGREIQHILWMVAKEDPNLLKSAFGEEYKNLQRFFRLKGATNGQCAGEIPIKRFICTIWLNGARRKLWERALARLGQSPSVRKLYDQLYALEEFDGGTLREYYQLWSILNLSPTEVDYAFFLDRITHIGGPPEASTEFVTKLSACSKAQEGALTPGGAARRCLSQIHPHPTQAQYRIARDVAYYIDAYRDGALAPSEITAWANYVPLTAEQTFGLSDQDNFTPPRAASITTFGSDFPNDDGVEMTPEEIAGCPASVMKPLAAKH